MGYFSKFNGGKGIPFMEDAEKLDIKTLLGVPVHITDYGFINGDDGEFIVMQFVEYPGAFVFGNAIITADIKEAESDLGSKVACLEELANQAIIFNQQTNKKGNRTYIAPTFVE